MGIDLVTLAEYKAYAGINSSNSDALLNNIIPKVSQFVKTYCRTTFVDHVYDPKVEVFKASNAGKLLLSELPLISVASLKFSDDYGKTYTDLTEFSDYVIDKETNSLELIGATLQAYSRVNAFKVSYTAGYDELPEDLKLGIYDLISYYKQHDVSVHSPKNIGSNTVQIEYILTAQLPAHIRRVLTLYSANYV